MYVSNTEHWTTGNIGTVDNGELIYSVLHMFAFFVILELFVPDSNRILFLHKRTSAKTCSGPEKQENQHQRKHVIDIETNSPDLCHKRVELQWRAKHSSFCLLVFLPVKLMKVLQFSSIRVRQNPLPHERWTSVAWRYRKLQFSLIKVVQEDKQMNCSYLQSLCFQSQDTLRVFEILLGYALNKSQFHHSPAELLCH